ncbi:Integrator complex subunit 9 [Coemansia javaensis]|uniref:Integrator complex subunit 9 n=1 Tax=Coemansia javaensis TaxID=2761396 RepID=A0A9W8LKU4_9FUNG|nr:Integrator complex subunit 9 [Coemansia javaensis]
MLRTSPDHLDAFCEYTERVGTITMRAFSIYGIEVAGFNMPRISVIPFSPSERHHLLLCELDDAMFVVDCGWPIEPRDDAQAAGPKTGAAQTVAAPSARDALSSINWARVDFVLISNYEQMTLLPYITEYTEFAGPVFATEPTKAYGRCVLEEGLCVASVVSPVGEACSSGGSSSNSNGSSGSSGGAEQWQPGVLPYTQQDVAAAMEKVTDVRYNEVATPAPFVQVYPRSAGYCIGSANWTVECKGHRTAFIGASSLAGCLHPQEWDGSVVADAQVIVFCDAVDPAGPDETDAGSAAPGAQVSQRIGQLCSTALAALKQRSRVLLVGEPYGVTQDILQLVAENALSLNLPLPQFVVVSPVAERTLQYGNIMGEWLCAAKQALLYQPEYPFADKDLRQRGHLHFARSLAELATRTIPQGTWFVVVSPRDVATISHFVRRWQLDAKQCSGADMAAGSGMARFAVLIHDDDVARAQRLVGQIAASEVTYVPVPRRLTVHAIRQCLASAVRAQHVLLPSPVYARLAAGPAAAAGLDFGLLEHAYMQATVVDLDTDRHLPLGIKREMTQQLRRSGKQRAVVSGVLSLAAGKIRLVPADDGDDDAAGPDAAPAPAQRGPALGPALGLRGWTPDRLASELCDAGLDAAVASDAAGPLVRVAVPGGTAAIRMHGGWAVDCSSATAQWAVLDALRQVLRRPQQQQQPQPQPQPQRPGVST